MRRAGAREPRSGRSTRSQSSPIYALTEGSTGSHRDLWVYRLVAVQSGVGRTLDVDRFASSSHTSSSRAGTRHGSFSCGHRQVARGAHPDVGSVEVRDDDDELTVSIGSITHGHFNTFGEALSDDVSAEQIADRVASFLRDLIADRVVFWSLDGSGGWRTLDDYERIDDGREPEAGSTCHERRRPHGEARGASAPGRG